MPDILKEFLREIFISYLIHILRIIFLNYTYLLILKIGLAIGSGVK